MHGWQMAESMVQTCKEYMVSHAWHVSHAWKQKHVGAAGAWTAIAEAGEQQEEKRGTTATWQTQKSRRDLRAGCHVAARVRF